MVCISSSWADVVDISTLQHCVMVVHARVYEPFPVSVEETRLEWPMIRLGTSERWHGMRKRGYTLGSKLSMLDRQIVRVIKNSSKCLRIDAPKLSKYYIRVAVIDSSASGSFGRALALTWRDHHTQRYSILDDLP